MAPVCASVSDWPPGTVGIDNHRNGADRIDLAKLQRFMFAKPEGLGFAYGTPTSLGKHNGSALAVGGVTSIEFDHSKSPLINRKPGSRSGFRRL